MLNFHLVAWREWGGPGPGRRGSQGLNVVTALSVGFATAEIWPALGRGSGTHVAWKRLMDWSCWLGCPALPSLAPSRGFLAQETCLCSKKLPPAGSSQPGCTSMREVALVSPPALQFEQYPHVRREGQDSCVPATPQEPRFSTHLEFCFLATTAEHKTLLASHLFCSSHTGPHAVL